MKKIFNLILLAIVVFSGCKKDDDSSLSNLSINYYNLSKSSVVFIDGKANDQTITFDIFIPNIASKDVPVSISVDPTTTAVEQTQFELSTKSVVIPAGMLKVSVNVLFHYSGFELKQSAKLVLKLSSTLVKDGANSTLELNVNKSENPLKTTFPGNYKGYYWNVGKNVGDYDDGDLWDSPITLAFDNSDPNSATMVMNNLWWGGENVKVTFDFETNTIHMNGNQNVDTAWEKDGWVLPWKITEVNGTFNPATRKLVFDYTVTDATGKVYGSYTAWVLPEE